MHLFDHRALRNYASDISSTRASRNWPIRFAKLYPELVAVKPVKLDPQRAKNFNEAL
jgi:hypothetical protein